MAASPRFEYVHGSGLTWHQYQQLNGVVDSTLVAVDESVRGAAMQLVDSHIARELYHAAREDGYMSESLREVGNLLEDLREGSYALGRDIKGQLGEIEEALRLANSELTNLGVAVDKVNSSVRILTGQMFVGFGVLSEQLRSVLDQMVSIDEAVRSPERIWAEEQYREALALAKRGKACDAFLYINRAIFGNQQHLGYIGDFRYYMLAGEILLGAAGANDCRAINLKESEQAFVSAEEYAPRRKTEILAVAAVHAAVAAYADGRVQSARIHSARALEYSPRNPFVLYHAAKYEAHVGDLTSARSLLTRAILLDWSFATRVASDGDFLRERGWLIDTLKCILDPIQVTNRASWCQLHDLCARCKVDIPVVAIDPERFEVFEALKKFVPNSGLMGEDNWFFALSDARTGLLTVRSMLRKAVRALEASLESIQTQLNQAKTLLESDNIPAAVVAGKLLEIGQRSYVYAVREFKDGVRSVSRMAQECVWAIERTVNDWFRSEVENNDDRISERRRKQVSRLITFFEETSSEIREYAESLNGIPEQMD